MSGWWRDTPEARVILAEESAKVAVAEALSEAAETIEAELVCGCIEEFGAEVYVPRSHHCCCWYAHLSARIVRQAASKAVAS